MGAVVARGKQRKSGRATENSLSATGRSVQPFGHVCLCLPFGSKVTKAWETKQKPGPKSDVGRIRKAR